MLSKGSWSRVIQCAGRRGAGDFEVGVMETAARFSTAFVICAAVALMAGCPDEENVTNIYQQQPAPVGSFPGTPEAVSNLAIDGRALSNPGEDVKALRFFDSGRDTAVVLFTTEESGRKHLYASYLDGETLTPPVELVGQNQDPTAEANLNQAFVAFLFPGNSRDGDAIVGFMRTDLDDDGNSNPVVGPNIRLFASYFDRSGCKTAADSLNPDIRYGFNTLAAPIDLTDDSFIGSDVTCAFFVTDGLRGAAEFQGVGNLEASAFSQGDAVSYLAVGWVQANASTSYPRLYRRKFDLTETNAANTFGSPTIEIALDSGAAATDYVYSQEIDVYENCVFFLKIVGADYFMMGSAFNPSAATPDFISAAHRIGPAASPFPTVQYLPGRENLYGPDEGIVNVAGFFRVTGAANLMEESLFAFQFASGTPAAAFNEANDRMDFDNGGGTPGPPYDVQFAWGWKTFMNRTGTWIGVLWFQPASPPPAPPMPVLFVNALQTTRTGTAPAIGSSDAGAVLVDSSVTTVLVDFFVLQQEVGYKGIQSNPNAVTVAYKHEVTALQDTLKSKKITFVPGAAPSLTIPGAANAVAFPENTLAAADVIVAEAGSAQAAAGDAALYFIKDAAVAPQESRRAVMLRPGGTELEIGSLVGAVGTYSPREAVGMKIVTVPRNADIANSPGWAGAAQHVFLTEYRYLDSQGSTALRHRVFDMTKAAADGACFSPAVDGSTKPKDIDSGQDTDAQSPEVFASGSVVGAYFMQGGHIWYNEFDGAAWYAASASSTGPQLVDNSNPAPVDTAGYSWSVFPNAYVEPRGLAGSAVFFSKILNPGGSDRLFARIRN